jgi:hypothetical protein
LADTVVALLRQTNPHIYKTKQHQLVYLPERAPKERRKKVKNFAFTITSSNSTSKILVLFGGPTQAKA